MNHALHTLVLLTALAGTSLAQAPQPAVKPSVPPAPITVKEVRVLPYSREHEKTSLEGKRGHPDELRVVTTTNKIHLHGKKRVESMKVDGWLICHSGKLALLPPVDRAGNVSIKVPPADDTTYYYAVLEMRDGTLQSSALKVELKKDYGWSFKSEGGESTFRVVDGPNELVAIKAPKDKIKAYGFSATVRWKDNEADLAFTVE